MDLSDMSFDDLAPVEVKVSVHGKKLILREASADAVRSQKNTMMKAARIGADGRPSIIDGAADSDYTLLSRCLYYADKDGRLPLDRQGNADSKFLVPLPTILNWANYIVEPLIKRLKSISHLDEEEKKDTVESLEKRIAEDSRKLQELTVSQNANTATDSTSGGDLASRSALFGPQMFGPDFRER